MRDANIIYDDFVKMVADNRGLPITKVRIIADGSTVLGQKAKELGLIDEIGGIEEAKKYLEEITEEDLVICWGE